jgi:hypothetical protein
MASVIAFTESSRTITWLGAFGADTPKGVQLVHTDASFGLLRMPKPTGKEQLCDTIVTPDGRKAYSGRKLELKESQCYPFQFAKQVAVLTAKRLLEA